MDFVSTYLDEVAQVPARLNRNAVQATVQLLVDLRARRGRLFVLGVGGSAGNGSVTAHSESFQAVIWHLLVSHPALQAAPMRWEAVER